MLKIIISYVYVISLQLNLKRGGAMEGGEKEREREGEMEKERAP